MTVQNLVPLAVLILFWGYAFYLLREAKTTRKMAHLRRMPSLDAIGELVGRAAELGKPVLLSPTDGATLRGAEAVETRAAISIMHHALRACARMDVRPIVVVGAELGAEVVPLVMEATRLAYVSEGKLDKFHSDIVNYVSGDQMAFAAGVVGMIVREQIASAVLVGPWKGSIVPILPTNTEIGAMQIGGTTRLVTMPMFAAFCDHLVLGEEVYAAGAYLSQEPSQVATLVAEDWAKYCTIALVILGVALAAVGIKLSTFLNM